MRFLFSTYLSVFIKQANQMSTSIETLPNPPSSSMNQAPPSTYSPNQNPSSSLDPNGQYNPNVEFPPKDNSQTLDSETAQELVRGLQEANSSGATSLPVRDISQSTTELQQDAQTQPNYVPPPTNRRVRFEEEDGYDEISEKNAANARRSQKFHSIYDELQTPILLAVLFFLFQLPIVRLTLFKHLPAMYCDTGTQMNLFGICFFSVAFGFGYMLINKLMGYVSSF